MPAENAGAMVGDILGTILPKVTTVLALLVIIIFAIVGIALFFYLFTAWSRPIVYDADIYERIGNDYRKLKGKVVYKRKGENMGYYVEKRPVPLTINDAYIGKNGKTSFALLKIEDRYIALAIGDQIQILDKTTKDPKTKKLITKEIEVAEFLPYTQLNEYEKSITQAVKVNAKKYRWTDKLAPLFGVAVPMIVLLLAFFLVAWSAQQNNAVTGALKAVHNDFGSIASSIAQVGEGVKQLAGVVVPNTPPPG